MVRNGRHNTTTMNNQRPCMRFGGIDPSLTILIPLVQVPQSLFFKGKSALVHGQAPGVVVHCSFPATDGVAVGPLRCLQTVFIAHIRTACSSSVFGTRSFRHMPIIVQEQRMCNFQFSSVRPCLAAM